MKDYSYDFLQLLSKQFPSINTAANQIIKLQATLNLPKGTEHFLSDIHGEDASFLHVLKNGSGVIKRKIDELFSDSLLENEKQKLATLIYYPEKKMPLLLREFSDKKEWFRITLYRLIKICRYIASKYTRSEVRKAIPQGYEHPIDELLQEQEGNEDKIRYYKCIIETIIEIKQAEEFIVIFAKLIQRLAIYRLHIIGDIYDRGPGSHVILDTLMDYHSVDVQWGNHDILWMGAASGSEACIANAIRISLRYGNTATLEDAYAISLLPLANFANEVYGNDACAQFQPKLENPDEYSNYEIQLLSRMQKAISIIQFKLEYALIDRMPHFQMSDRRMLDRINYVDGSIHMDNGTEKLLDTEFPTIHAENPACLTDRELQLMEKLKLSFLNSDKLQKHVRFLYSHGSLYKVYNNNLLFHGCIPLNSDGSFFEYTHKGKVYSGKSFLDRLDKIARQAYFTKEDNTAKQYGKDILWYLWGGTHSPLYGKDKMATFERYLLANTDTHKENKNPYYNYRDNEKICCNILHDFGLNSPSSHIINGHVPVKVKKGELPIKANGRLIVIDGGFAKAYQAETGIAGYTLIFNSYGLQLAAHRPFISTQRAIENEEDIHSTRSILEVKSNRIRIQDTDTGTRLSREINALKALITAYREGSIKEQDMAFFTFE